MILSMRLLTNKKKFNSCLVTYTYKGCEKYLNRFKKTIHIQKYKNFDVLIFNDKCNLKNFQTDYSYRIINNSKSIFKNRVDSLKFLLKMKYKKVHFLDIDDSMSSDRILKLDKALDKYNIVFCNIHVRNKKKILHTNYLNKFLKKKIFRYADLIHQNFLGFSNTSVNLNNLKSEVKKIFLMKYSSYVSDWPIFFQFAIKNNIYFVKNTFIEYYTRPRSITQLPLKLNQVNRKFILDLKIKFYNQFKNLKLVNNELKKLNLLKKKSSFKSLKLISRYTGWWGAVIK